MSIKVEAYNQNYEQFRSLNQIMWQVPVLAMTLTGGLWFGVSTILDNPLLVTVLLVTAVVGNLAFVAILFRFRHVMQCYMDWIEQADKECFVNASLNQDASGRLERFANQNKMVRSLFSLMLAWAAGCSMVLLAGYWIDRIWLSDMEHSHQAIEYYDQQAEMLADSYEAVAFESAYPFLVDRLRSGALEIADIGAGTGRDAAWLAARGHVVTAVEPSDAMRRLAQNLHSNGEIVWVAARLPTLSDPALQNNQFDLVLANAVWMHVSPGERLASLERIDELLKPGRSAIISLRMGPADPARGMFTVDPTEFVLQARQVGFDVVPQGDFPDVLGRPEVSWKVYELIAPT